MARKSAYFKEIERLLKIGYEPADIIKKSGISKPTVYRIINKLQIDSRYEFKRTMSHHFLWKYQQNMENFSRTIQEMNEEIEIVKAKYDEIEQSIKESIEELVIPKQSMTKATLLQGLISCQSSRSNELIKLAQQRDKATEGKAKLFNQGPVVHAVHEWVNSAPPPMGVLPSIPELDNLREEKPPILGELAKLNTTTLTEEEEEELRIQKEMEDENES